VTAPPGGSGSERGEAEAEPAAIEERRGREKWGESAADRFVRYGWSLLLIAASVFGWIVDHCRSSDPAGAVIQAVRLFRGTGRADRGEKGAPAGEAQETQETRSD
jgi:hypothetical protein